MIKTIASLFLVQFLILSPALAQNSTESTTWIFNTTNQQKIIDYKKFLSGLNLEFTSFEVREVLGTVDQVAFFKAAEFNTPGTTVIIEDSSLEVEGAEIGSNVKHLLNELPKHIGKRATWAVVLAYQYAGKVFLFKGETQGQLVAPKNSNVDTFEEMFLPDGEKYPLSVNRPDHVNPRLKAAKALLSGKAYRVAKAFTWTGGYQTSYGSLCRLLF